MRKLKGQEFYKALGGMGLAPSLPGKIVRKEREKRDDSLLFAHDHGTSSSNTYIILAQTVAFLVPTEYHACSTIKSSKESFPTSHHLSSLLSQWRHARSVRYNIRRSSSSLLPLDSRLRAPTARALALGTRACASIASTLTSRLLGPRNMLHCFLILLHTSIALPALQIRQTPCLGVDISNLLVALCVETCEFLTCRRAHRFLEV